MSPLPPGGRIMIIDDVSCMPMVDDRDLLSLSIVRRTSRSVVAVVARCSALRFLRPIVAPSIFAPDGWI